MNGVLIRSGAGASMISIDSRFTKMKKNYQRFFENERGIDYWNNIYKQQGFYGDSFRQRADIALSWVNNLALSGDLTDLDAGCGTGRGYYSLNL